MEKVTETWVTAPERPVSTVSREACLVHIYPTGPGMGARYKLGETPRRDRAAEARPDDADVDTFRHQGR